MAIFKEISHNNISFLKEDATLAYLLKTKLSNMYIPEYFSNLPFDIYRVIYKVRRVRHNIECNAVCFMQTFL